ncbi:MAG: LptF/LptG family permease [Planctomycetes bacterium]|jgi:lipopolysaccharide export system permease protein|nr:LptF/LptG family permease [Planctomycetota bacterium]
MVFWGIIHRMVLIELLKVFSVALVAITGLILLAGIFSEAMRNGFGPLQILMCIPLLLPSLLPYTIPPTTLFATCVVYGRLSADSEILALKAAGVHVVHVVWPAILLGLVTSAITMYFFLELIPSTGNMLRNQVFGDVEELLYGMLRKDGVIAHPNISVEIHVKSVHGRKLHDAIFKRRAADGKGFDVIAYAKEAELRVDLAHRLIMVHMRQCQIVQGNSVGFVDSKIWPVEIPNGFGGSETKHRAMDMTWMELFAYHEKARLGQEQTADEIKLREAQMVLGNPQTKDEKDLAQLVEILKYHRGIMTSTFAEMHMRPALALGCLCFALVGCPVGIWFSKSDYLSAFITCFIPIVVIYYPLMLCMFNMARVGTVPPWAGVFAADAIMLVIGLILFRRMARN